MGKKLSFLLIILLSTSLLIEVGLCKNYYIEDINEALNEYLDFIIKYSPYLYTNMYDEPDLGYGKSIDSASFSIDFLIDLYNNTYFYSKNGTAIYNKIVESADFLVSQQVLSGVAYGGFPSVDGGTWCYSIGALRALNPLIKAYQLTDNSSYWECANRVIDFLNTTQVYPSRVGLHDKYYGGFAQVLTTGGAWVTNMWTVDLYGLEGLKAYYLLTLNSTVYNMLEDMALFYQEGFEMFKEYYNPLPYGNNEWHGVGDNELYIYDDDFGYSIYGLHSFGWNETLTTNVYNYINNATSDIYPLYNPSNAWSGYIDVVNHTVTNDYYDLVTLPILGSYRQEYEPETYMSNILTVLDYKDSCYYWGLTYTFLPKFTAKSIIVVAWIGRFLVSAIDTYTTIVESDISIIIISGMVSFFGAIVFLMLTDKKRGRIKR